MSPAQLGWIGALAAVPGCSATVAFPDDFARVLELLADGPASGGGERP